MSFGSELLSVILLLVGILASVLAIKNAQKISKLKDNWQALQDQLHAMDSEKSKLESELKDIQNNLTTNFLHDPVTGLPGRSVFDNMLIETLRQSNRHKLVFSIILLDVDEFKMINSVMGVESGDILLKEMAERFKNCIRKVDIISRFSDDKFAFLLPEITKAETAAYVAQRLLEVTTSPFKIQGQELFVTASIGVVVYPEDGDNVRVLLENADIALQQAKLSGGNTHQFYREELYNLTRRELVLSSCLRGSTVYQEFILNYLPVICTQTKKIISMEALLRWHHPDLGLIPPQDFLRLAESNGSINEIGDWVLQNACKQFQAWKTKGLDLDSISVNVSLRQLENPNFTYRVSQILHEAKLETNLLILEISESVLLPRLELVEKTLRMLKHLGVQVAIDDFGTGFLSLQHLRLFPVGYLKIDNSLTHDITVNHESEAIVKMILQLGESLNIQVVAEGVENPAQQEKLKKMGCRLMQGFYFSKPLAPEEFTKDLLQSHF